MMFEEFSSDLAQMDILIVLDLDKDYDYANIPSQSADISTYFL